MFKCYVDLHNIFGILSNSSQGHQWSVIQHVHSPAKRHFIMGNVRHIAAQNMKKCLVCV